VGQQSNDRWERCAYCGVAWPKKLTGEWAVVRPDKRLEMVVTCACGQTMLLVRATVAQIHVVDLAAAKRGEMSADDMETMAGNLMAIAKKVGAHLGQDRGAVRANARREREKQENGG
jgi:hypothetical protein